MSHNTIFFGTPRLSSREDDLYLPDPETIIASYEPPTVLPPTIQDHHDVIQVQLDATQTLMRVLIVTVAMIAVAALVVVIAFLGQMAREYQLAGPVKKIMLLQAKIVRVSHFGIHHFHLCNGDGYQQKALRFKIAVGQKEPKKLLDSNNGDFKIVIPADDGDNEW
ncbi:hypothetical protein F5H01DRAFT_417603 [Linnemannia elongata]|nr:hypothetical protein F5H01DRAFT_417603 [Linnemannia elongata]